MTAIRINLLPHREQRRALQQKALLAMLGGAAVAGLAAVLLGHFVIAGMKDHQDKRNEFLKVEIAKLDAQIKEIAQLKEKTNALLARKQVVEDLQVNRAQVVHLFDELAREMPDGMYLKSLKQTGDKLALSGYAQSSARVSALMRNIESSQWLTAPRLIEVKVSSQNKMRVNEFSLEAMQKIPNVPGAPDDANKGTGSTAAKQGATDTKKGGQS
ncbi:fimbrial protein [Parasulfuritortus cantonensis]|uniref:Fimbrial protein n=1 Tax=Parasulfuritortus cantonensis TaxID=2528202 RepID=A0A4R1BIS6_9PROT|nr:PilN domain-containing protein [Parasulfuritortus cantonensis]TCJ17235.1 fimbrial protein [Parasulfuritortus cantonensis]